MARIRSIKPEFWTSEQVMSCDPVTRLLFIGMWNFADDYGRMPFAPATIKAQVLPGDTIPIDEVRRMVMSLNERGLVMIYSANGRDYIEITGWQHQKIDKPHKPKHPAPFIEPATTIVEPSPNVSGTLAVGEERIREEKRISPRVAHEDFEKFWIVYPKRHGENPKAPAEKSFLKAIKSGANADEIIGAAQKFGRTYQDKVGTEFISMAVTWLNQRRWEDYRETAEEKASREKNEEFMRSKGFEWNGERYVKVEAA